MDRRERIKWLRDADNLRDLALKYDTWGEEYDKDLEEVFKHSGNQQALEVVVKYVSKTDKILDAGAGTGILGQMLHQHGYGNLEALDMSQGMLEQARKKNVYTALHRKVLGEELDFASDTYDAVLIRGVFVSNSAPSRSFDELIRIAKQGGYIIFTIHRPFYYESDFKDKQLMLETSGKWKLRERVEKLHSSDSLPDTDIWVYQVC